MPHADLPVAGHGVVILIDPPSYHYFENRFFDLTTLSTATRRCVRTRR